MRKSTIKDMEKMKPSRAVHKSKKTRGRSKKEKKPKKDKPKRKVEKRKEKRIRRVNVLHAQSMVENDDGLETARVQQKKCLKGELKRKPIYWYGSWRDIPCTFVAAIYETKWFRDNMYKAEDHVILHSGCRLLGKGETLKRGKGVGIVLSQVATKAWGESSEEYGYRIITTRLKISGTKHLFIIFSYACFYTDFKVF